VNPVITLSEQDMAKKIKGRNTRGQAKSESPTEDATEKQVNHAQKELVLAEEILRLMRAL
jgi:hypothetical protein